MSLHGTYHSLPWLEKYYPISNFGNAWIKRVDTVLLGHTPEEEEGYTADRVRERIFIHSNCGECLCEVEQVSRLGGISYLRQLFKRGRGQTVLSSLLSLKKRVESGELSKRPHYIVSVVEVQQSLFRPWDIQRTLTIHHPGNSQDLIEFVDKLLSEENGGDALKLA